MDETWRWFGPEDIVRIDDIAQAGANGIVTSLHHIRPGEVWTKNEIDKRHKEISIFKNGSASKRKWRVVESLPVSEEVKKQSGNWQCHIENYIKSMQNIAESGVFTICYNFMPILDWTRTDLSWRLSNGARCLRFDLIDFLIFDVYILKRSGAKSNYLNSQLKSAEKRLKKLSQVKIDQLTYNIIRGLPGSVENLSINDIKKQILSYSEISEKQLRKNFIEFLSRVVPAAQDLGIKLCCHPDDPPFDLFGIPRVVSTYEDLNFIFKAIPSLSNGLTFCTGSLGVRPDNNLKEIFHNYAERIHFLHLRSTKRDDKGNFYEANHLEGDLDMFQIVRAILLEEKKRKKVNRSDWKIPMRPDHGHQMLDDLNKKTNPGYSAIGRLRGLAEIRGLALGIDKILS